MQSKVELKREVNIGIVTLIVALIFLRLTYTVPENTNLLKSYAISPRLVPKLTAILGIIASMSILIPSVLKYMKFVEPTDINKFEGRKLQPFMTKDRVFVIISTSIYLILINYLGYIITTIIFSFTILMHLDKTHMKRNIIFSVLCPIIIYLLFNNLLQIWLPVGKIFG